MKFLFPSGGWLLLVLAGAGTGKGQQRLEELHATHIGEIDARAVSQRRMVLFGTRTLDAGERTLIR